MMYLILIYVFYQPLSLDTIIIPIHKKILNTTMQPNRYLYSTKRLKPFKTPCVTRVFGSLETPSI